MFYNGKKLEEQGRLFNYIIGARKTGKTVWAKKKMIDIGRAGRRFCYVRRKKVELENMNMSEFFEKLREREISYLSDEEIITAKHSKFFLNGEMFGYIVPLSTAENLRSVDFLDVDAVFFEEFIIQETENTHYLKNEVNRFLELYMTITRNRDIPVYFIGNKIEEYNPYFLYFDLIPPERGIKVRGEHCIEIIDDPENVQSQKKTRIAKLLEGTRYGKYAIENKSLNKNDMFVRKLPKNAYPCFDFAYENKRYGVYKVANTVYITTSPTNKLCVSVDARSSNPDTIPLNGFRDTLYYNMYNKAVKRNNIYYNNSKAEQVGRDIARLTM